MLTFGRISHIRFVSTVKGHPHIVRKKEYLDPALQSLISCQYTFPDPSNSTSHILSLLPSEPTKPDLAIGTTTKLPPTPDSFEENPKFLPILEEVLSEHATEDPEVKSQAQVMISTAGANLGSGGMFFAPHRGKKGPGYGGGGGTGGDSAGGASGQGGAGSGGRGGWIHVSDSRRPPDYGRIAWFV